jgi:HD superfamily phosphohydrolase
MRIYAKGVVQVDDEEYPYYVMELFENVADSDDWIAQPEVTEGQFLSFLDQVFGAVEYMHSQNQIHLDLKPGNILVQTNGRPIIADLGFAKVIRLTSGVTIIGGTEGFIHPEARALIEEVSSDPNRLRGEAERELLKPTWDLFALGKTILRLLQIADDRPTKRLSRYAHRYLKLLACRLLDGNNNPNELLLGLSRESFQELRYESASDALNDLRKLTGQYNLETRIPELSTYPLDTIQASTLATTPFTQRVAEVVRNPMILRLAGFTQLSLLNLIYPTAVHTRFEHVIGTFSAMIRYIIALYNDPLNPLFKQIMREQDINAALLIALLHDVGHYALAHDLEEVDRKTFSHETRGKELIESDATLLETLTSERLDDGSPGWAIAPSRLAAILESNPHKMEGSIRDRLILSLIDGPLDCDKLDYIIRDSRNLGLPYGRVVDVERLLRSLTVVSKDAGGGRTYVALGIHQKGRVTAEAVAFARYALYGSVYWHHAYRAIKSMLTRAGWEYLELMAKADEKKKEGISKAVRRDLEEFLTAAGSPQVLPLMTSVLGGQIHPGDLAMLLWVADRSGDVGKELMRLVEERKLFKRVHVLSRFGNETLWRGVYGLMGNENDWRRKLQFQRAFQAEVVRRIEQQKGPDVQATSIVYSDERNRFLAAGASGTPLLLVDAPPDRPGAKRGLELIEEEDRRRAKLEEFKIGDLEQSLVWKSLREELQESIGKVRVFCHPDHHRFLSAALSQEAIEQSLEFVLP